MVRPRCNVLLRCADGFVLPPSKLPLRDFNASVCTRTPSSPENASVSAGVRVRKFCIGQGKRWAPSGNGSLFASLCRIPREAAKRLRAGWRRLMDQPRAAELGIEGRVTDGSYAYSNREFASPDYIRMRKRSGFGV